MANDDDKLYGYCFTGYQYRDQLIPQEFSFMTQSFVLLLTMMGVARAVPIEEWISQVLTLVIGFAGFFALFAYSLDLHANATCKGRLRTMMLQMERGETALVDSPREKLESNQVYYWHFIEHRTPSLLERTARKCFGPQVSAVKGFMLAAYVYLLAWIVLTSLLVYLPKFSLFAK